MTSEMQQAMDTWIKGECVEIGESLFDIYHMWDNFYDALFEMSRDWAEDESAPPGWRINQVIDSGRLLGEAIKGHRDIPESEKQKVNSMIESVLAQVPPSGWPLSRETAQTMKELQPSLQHILMERVVECQCGKPERM